MIKFTKMHGCGNDYIYINCFDGMPDNINGLATAMSARHSSVGADGVVCICPSDKADAFMRMFNADGSEGKMCGNAIRCVGKYLYERRICHRSELSIETLSGIKYLSLNVENGIVKSVRVNMGAAVFDCDKIPVLLDGEAINREVDLAGAKRHITCVSMGNPHCVIFTDDVQSLDLEKEGPLFEHDALFPEGINTEFIKVISPDTLEMRVWERGSGETFACGTGACAAVAAAVRCGICRSDTPVTVKLRGGDLVIGYTDSAVFMTGGAITVYEGEYYENQR